MILMALWTVPQYALTPSLRKQQDLFMTDFHQPAPLQKLMRSTIMFVCLATLLLTCLQVLAHGYFPSDDALRHVAKVISNRDWSDILVIRPEITMDSHPGWHFILDLAGRVVAYDNSTLLNFSVLFLFLVFTGPLVLYFRRPEAWLLVLLITAVFASGHIQRMLLGRPYIFSMLLVLVFCFLWSRIRDKDKPFAELGAYALLVALSTWIHGTWYLLALPLVALLICGQWRVLWMMSAATAVGVLAGAVLTGSPLAFLYQMFWHALSALGEHEFQRQLVTELRPFGGVGSLLMVVGLLLVWRAVRGDWKLDCVWNPVFVLAGLCWVMGFVTGRFWLDWGWPALAFWMGMEIHRAMESHIREFDPRRLAIVGVVCLSLFLAVSNDRGNRWSGTPTIWPDMQNEEHRPWLPEEGGIVYNDSMRLFYNVFNENPHGPWRYMLGFEPIWMPEKHLEIYRQIQLSRGRPDSYQPWVEKMTPKDRMMLVRRSHPRIEGLEWHEVTPDVWSGRVDTEETGDEPVEEE